MKSAKVSFSATRPRCEDAVFIGIVAFYSTGILGKLDFGHSFRDKGVRFCKRYSKIWFT